jgi:capsular exopolysaccharide synthesis family protein
MDRIQKALDKAKAKHTASAEQLSVTAKNTASQRALESNAAPHQIDNIAYAQTKVETTPRELLEESRIIAGFYNNPQSAVFRMLRTQVLQKMRNEKFRSLAITSPTAGEGKSLVASNLAIAIAMELNQTVLLVDMDLRNPTLSNYFDLNVKSGLKAYLEGDIELKDILINPGIKRLVILPGSGRAEDSAELLSSPKMANLVSDIKSHYDSRIIIFDVPPILQTDDVLLSSKYFDSTLLVLEDGKNTEADIKKSLQLLEGHHLIGTVLNKSDKPPTHQNY